MESLGRISCHLVYIALYTAKLVSGVCPAFEVPSTAMNVPNLATTSRVVQEKPM
jgi:hypothetical protein